MSFRTKKRSPKVWILRFNARNKDSAFSFHAIEQETKKVETRAATPKYRSIKRGDTLVLTLGKKKIERVVQEATWFKDILALLKKYPAEDIMPGHSVKELESAYRSFPGYPGKIKKFGILGILLRQASIMKV